MIKLTIYGRLRKFVGKSTFEIQAKSAKEAFSFLINNFQGIREHIKEQEYCVMAGDLRLTEDLLDMQTESDIKIIPIVHGEIFPIIFGAGALFASAALPAAILGSTVLATIATTALTMIGTNLIVSGITDLLSPDPKPFNSQRQEDPQDPNYAFSGLLNNSKQGVPINIVYGEVLVGSTVVSSSVDSFQVVNEES
jgi:predicted phage tail protein